MSTLSLLESLPCDYLICLFILKMNQSELIWNSSKAQGKFKTLWWCNQKVPAKLEKIIMVGKVADKKITARVYAEVCHINISMFMVFCWTTEANKQQTENRQAP